MDPTIPNGLISHRDLDFCQRRPDLFGDMARPLEPECRVVQFSEPKDDDTLRLIADLMKDRPDVELYVFGGVKTLEFLRFFDTLRSFHLAVWDIEDISGFAYLSVDFQRLIFPKTKKRFSLRFLEILPGLTDLFLEGHTKDFAVVSGLTQLESLGLHGVKLADLTPLLPLRRLKSLRLSGKTRDLWRLPEFEELKTLRLFSITELANVDMLRDVTSLKSIELIWMRNVARLPNLSRLQRLEELLLDTMKGLTDISGAAAAPALKKLAATGTPLLTSESFRCFIGHPALQEIFGYVGRSRDNDAIKRMFPAIAR